MKLDARHVEAFLRAPGTVRAVILYGDDVGLIRERGTGLVVSVAGTRDDPFRVVELDRASVGTLPDELASVPLNGGRRVVHVRDGGDFIVEPLQRALSARGGGFVVIEAAGLLPRSKLRALGEASAECVAIGCYPDDMRALGPTIRAALRDADVTVDEDALSWLTTQLGADRAVTRREIEKLAVYAGAGGRIDAAAAHACVGDLAGLSLEDCIDAAMAGDLSGADRALGVAAAEGAAPVQIVRGALQHVQRLHQARLAMTRGVSAMDAAKAARPPLFYRRVRPFTEALSIWTTDTLRRAAHALTEAERACKTTGAPADAISREAILRLAQRSAASARRRPS